MTNLNIFRLKCYLKDNPVCLDLAYFKPKNKTSYFWVIFPIFLIDAVNSLVKKCIHYTFQIRGEKTQRQQDSLKQT